MTDDPGERMRRWRLVLGEAGVTMPLSGGDARIDAALGALYDSDGTAGRADRSQRQAGFGASAPRVARWLGDIRTYFPSPVVRIMQRDALPAAQLATECSWSRKRWKRSMPIFISSARLFR